PVGPPPDRAVVVPRGGDLDGRGRSGQVLLDGQERAAGVADQRPDVPVPQARLVPPLAHERSGAHEPPRGVLERPPRRVPGGRHGEGGQPPARAVSRSPTSDVRTGPCGSRVDRSKATAALTFFAWSPRPRWSSSSPTESTVAVGSARPWPAMSGAEPCTGSNMLGAVRSGLMLPEAARPIPPAMAAA